MKIIEVIKKEQLFRPNKANYRFKVYLVRPNLVHYEGTFYTAIDSEDDRFFNAFDHALEVFEAEIGGSIQDTYEDEQGNIYIHLASDTYKFISQRLTGSRAEVIPLDQLLRQGA